MTHEKLEKANNLAQQLRHLNKQIETLKSGKNLIYYDLRDPCDHIKLFPELEERVMAYAIKQVQDQLSITQKEFDKL